MAHIKLQSKNKASKSKNKNVNFLLNDRKARLVGIRYTHHLQALYYLI